MHEKHIKRQLIKFNFYGFFKNLKFFDPYLWVYLNQNGLDLTKIGLLIAIRELIIYVFEIPSGVFADKFGKKTELVICFLFYILSFVFFFIGQEFYIFVIAFILFGFGEAFRSGTHKAMIIEFLEIHEIKDDKSKVYGLTRSYSLIGSALSSLLGVLFVIVLPNLQLLFIIAIIPYVLDLLLILSYPSYLNIKDENNVTFKDFVNGITVVVVYFLRDKSIRNTLIDSAAYNAIFKTIKDYIQPILLMFMTGVILIQSLDDDDNIKVIIGITYTIIFLISSYASKSSHKLLKRNDRDKLLYMIWGLSAIVVLLLGVFVDSLLFVVLFFILIYILQNIRKPLMVEKIGDISKKTQRASILSVESQLTSLFIIILAPLFGFVFEQFGAMYIFYIIMIINVVFFIVKKRENN